MAHDAAFGSSHKSLTFTVVKRTLYILFSVYFLVLALAPCGDARDCNENRTSELCKVEHQHEQDSHEDEDCTPLCTCSCCAATFLVDHQTHFLGHVSLVNTVYTIHNNRPETGAIISFWQPPKIS